MIQSRKKLTETVQTLFKSSRSDPGVGGPTIARPSPEYATVRYAFGIKLQIYFVNVNVIGGVDDSPPCALVKYLSHRRQTRHPFLDTLSSSSVGRGVSEPQTCNNITVVVEGRFACQGEIVSSRPQFVSMAQLYASAPTMSHSPA